jgi:putative ABC transport system permease protein
MGFAPWLIVRGGGDQARLVQDLKTAVVGADAFAEVTSVRTTDQIVDEILFPRRLATAILAVSGLIGLALASIGLYGVVSYSVAERVREIGIRTTLGADRRDIAILIVKEGARVAAAGSLGGLVLAVIALVTTAKLIRNLPSGDVLTFVVVPVVLAAVVLLACYLPARRAARVDPARILRGL